MKYFYLSIAAVFACLLVISVPEKAHAQNPNPCSNITNNATIGEVLSAAVAGKKPGTCTWVVNGSGKGTGTMGSVTIGGTANQTAVSGTCTGTTTINCTIAFSATPILPNGTTNTTQATGDGTTKTANDAFIANALQSINPATSVQVSTTTVLPNTPMYSNGTAGVGATLTAGSNTTLAAIDGYSVLLNDRILVQNQVTTANNGCYTLTATGSGGAPWVLTRCVDYNSPTNINYTGLISTLQTGSMYAADTGFNLAALIATVGTSAITYNQAATGSGAGKPGGGVNFTGNTTPGDAIKVGPGGSGKNITDTGVAFSSLTQTIGSGTIALTTGGISSATCTSALTLTVTGTATTDTIIANFNGDPTGITGYAPSTSGSLYLYMYPTSNTVNVKECNNTSSTITPSAATLNVRVVR